MSQTTQIGKESRLYLDEKSVSANRLEKIAARFAGELHPGDVVAFYGELGSGKTFFIKALCRALDASQEATSPSFTIINEYQTRRGQILYHFDFYRMVSEAELQNLGLDEFFYNDYLCFIEWADKIRDYLPPKRWEIYMDFVAEEPEQRNVTILKTGGLSNAE